MWAIKMQFLGLILQRASFVILFVAVFNYEEGMAKIRVRLKH